MAEKLLYVEEVAEMLRKSPASIRWMIANHAGPRFALIGGRRMARESEVLAYIDAQFAAANDGGKGVA